MDEKKGLVTRIMSQAQDAGHDPSQKVQRKKITLDQLQQVIGQYVKMSAGMGDPELRSAVVQLELSNSTLKQQFDGALKALESARAGWKKAQDELGVLAKEREGAEGGVREQLATSRREADHLREECSRLKGKLAAIGMESTESSGQNQVLKAKVEQFAARLDESKRNEKKMRQEIHDLTSMIRRAGDAHKIEIDALENRIEEMEAAFDHVESVPSVDFESIISRAKALGARAGELSVGEEPRVTSALEAVEERCTRIRLRLEAARDEIATRISDMEAGLAGMVEIRRLVDLHERFLDSEVEIADLETLVAALAPPGEVI